MKAGLALGVVMVVLAVGWVNLVRQRDLVHDLGLADLWLALPGAMIGVAFAFLVWGVGRRLAGTRHIVAMLAHTLDLSAMQCYHVLLFSLLAALPEEILFRGALQPEVGLLLASLVFGALHAITRLYFLYATCAGLLLGVLYIAGGTLWMPVGAHFAVDLVMFFLLLGRRNHVIG